MEEARKDKFNRFRRLSACASTLVLALIAFTALYPAVLNGAQVDTQDTVAASSVTEAVDSLDGISQFKEDRQKTREEEMRQLQEVAQDESADAEIRQKAQEQIMQVCGWIEQEATIEGVLRSRGYVDCVATVHTDSVNILIKTSSLTREETAVILDLATRETKQSGGNVKIIPLAD